MSLDLQMWHMWVLFVGSAIIVLSSWMYWYLWNKRYDRDE